MRVFAMTSDKVSKIVEIDLETMGGFDNFIYADKHELIPIIEKGCCLAMYKEDLKDYWTASSKEQNK